MCDRCPWNQTPVVLDGGQGASPGAMFSFAAEEPGGGRAGRGLGHPPPAAALPP